MSARSGFSLGAAGYMPVGRPVTEADGKTLTKVFHTADEGSKGYLTRHEVKVAMVEMFGYKPTKVFHTADEGSKGYLTRHEVKVAMVEMFGYKPTKYEVNQMLEQHGGSDTDKGMSLETFLLCMTDKLHKVDEDEEIRHTFMAFDMQCHGFLTLEDFKKVFAQVAPHVNAQTIQSAFREIDQDCDGRVSYKDFEFLMKYNTEDHF